jgi:hypothetical protein
MTYEEALDNQLALLREKLLAKHRAYGLNLLRRGEAGIRTRMEDKLERWDNLAAGAPEGDESGDDTIRDLAGYAVQALMLRENTYTLPMAEHRETARVGPQS